MREEKTIKILHGFGAVTQQKMNQEVMDLCEGGWSLVQTTVSHSEITFTLERELPEPETKAAIEQFIDNLRGAGEWVPQYDINRLIEDYRGKRHAETLRNKQLQEELDKVRKQYVAKATVTAFDWLIQRTSELIEASNEHTLILDYDALVKEARQRHAAEGVRHERD